MNTQEDPRLVDPTTVPYARPAFTQGAIAALILIAVGLIFNLTGMVQPGENSGMVWIANLLNWGIMGYFMYAAAIKHRDQDLGGYISFGRAFAVGAMVLLAIVLITVVWSYIYFALIDPDIFTTIRDASLEQMVEQRGMSEEDAEAALDTMSFMWTPGGMSIMAGIGVTVAGLIIDAIIAAVVKRNNPAYA